MSSNTQIKGVDITLPCTQQDDRNVLMKDLTEWFAKWAFQKEEYEKKDENGATRYHWQIRARGWHKYRLQEWIKKAGKTFNGNWSVTSKEVHEGSDFNYVMKADTRVDGPWTDQDYEVPPQLTRQLKYFKEKEMRPWQAQMLEMVTELDDRSIKCIYDPKGDSGKSILCEFLEYEGLGFEIPMMDSMEDIMQCVMGGKAKKCYMVDMPRGLKKTKLSQFYAGLECLKNGVAYDKRYAFKKKRFDRPQIVVFTNALPDMELLTRDRWEIWDMQEDFSLERHVFLEEEDLEDDEVSTAGM